MNCSVSVDLDLDLDYLVLEMGVCTFSSHFPGQDSGMMVLGFRYSVFSYILFSRKQALLDQASFR